MAEIRVTRVREHVRFEVGPREAESLLLVINDALSMSDFDLNEFEEEVLTELRDQLSGE